MSTRSHDAIIKKIIGKKIDFVELWFVDVFGSLHSLGIPTYSITEQQLRTGFDKLDSSSIRGFGSIDESDVSLVPDIGTYRNLPPDYDANGRRNARMFADIVSRHGNRAGAGSYDRDSRGVCKRAEGEISKIGLGAFWGPEIEFFVFGPPGRQGPMPGTEDGFDGPGNIESGISRYNEMNAYRNFKSGYYQAQPADSLNEFRKDVCDDLHRFFDVRVEAQHHEVATIGQCEINISYGKTLEMADSVVTARSLTKVKAARRNMVATFMPKPIYGDNASAMHMHHSLWDAHGRNAMYDQDEKKSGISQLARYYIGGILDHAAALCAIANPTTNSYKRLVPGYEAPVYSCWGLGNRSAAIRVPRTEKNEKKTRIEYRVSDSSANPYLLESSLMMAGIDGIRKKTDPGDPVEANVYKLTHNQRRRLGIKSLPDTLKDSLDHLQSDHGFLRGVFSDGLLEAYISAKHAEYGEFAQMPTSWEMSTYSSL